MIPDIWSKAAVPCMFLPLQGHRTSQPPQTSSHAWLVTQTFFLPCTPQAPQPIRPAMGLQAADRAAEGAAAGHREHAEASPGALTPHHC